MRGMSRSYPSENLAIKDGRRIFKHFKFPAAWRIVVWENLGWHLRFECGTYVRLYYDPQDTSFTPLIGGEHGGRCDWTDNIYDVNPYRALTLNLDLMERDLKRVNKIAAACRAAGKGWKSI